MKVSEREIDDWFEQDIEVSRRDTYSLDSVLAPIIAAGLKRFKEVVDDPDSVVGHPSRLKFEDVPEYVYRNIEGEHEQLCHSWSWVIGEMLFAFEAEEPDQFNSMSDVYFGYMRGVKIIETPLDNGCFEIRFPEKTMEQKNIQWKYDWEDLVIRIRRERGLNLFAKYFTDLWW